MKRIIASLMAASVLAGAGVAAAQSFDDRVDRLQDRIDRGVDDQTLSPDQADRLRGDLSRLRDERDSLDSQGQLSDWQRRDFQSRLDDMSYRISRNEYYNRYGTYRGYFRGWDPDRTAPPQY